MAKYEFEDNAIFHERDKADPDVIGNALDEIARKHENKLRPHDVLDEARAPDHPLHRHFIWDNDKAAELYRLDQARTLIRSVRIITMEDINQESARAYHSVYHDGRSYRSHGEIKTSVSLQLSLYMGALRDLRAWERKYRSIADICELITGARERLEQSIAAMKGENPAGRGQSTDESRPSV